MVDTFRLVYGRKTALLCVRAVQCFLHLLAIQPSLSAKQSSDTDAHKRTGTEEFFSLSTFLQRFDPRKSSQAIARRQLSISQLPDLKFGDIPTRIGTKSPLSVTLPSAVMDSSSASFEANRFQGSFGVGCCNDVIRHQRWWRPAGSPTRSAESGGSSQSAVKLGMLRPRQTWSPGSASSSFVIWVACYYFFSSQVQCSIVEINQEIGNIYPRIVKGQSQE